MLKEHTYISSRMSGLPQWNYPAFFSKQEQLESKGIKVWNPAADTPLEDTHRKTWSQYLADDLLTLERDCRELYLFGQWYRSPGALVELLAAIRLGLVITVEQWHLKPVQYAANKWAKCYKKPGAIK